MKKFCVIMAFVACFFVSCGKQTDLVPNDTINSSELTLEERKDIFVSYFNYSEEYKPADIKKKLDNMQDLKVLTLDEALKFFWVESGFSPTDYLRKTDSNGQVYYQHKTQDNKISVYVNPLCEVLTENTADGSNTGTYGFIVRQSNGQNFLIKIDGCIEPIQ